MMQVIPWFGSTIRYGICIWSRIGGTGLFVETVTVNQNVTFIELMYLIYTYIYMCMCVCVCVCVCGGGGGMSVCK